MGRENQIRHVKWKTVIALKTAGICQNEITRQLGIFKSSISKILKQDIDERTERDHAILPRSGRPQKLTRRLQSLIKKSINVNPYETANQLKYLLQN